MIRCSQLPGHPLSIAVLVATVLFTGCSATYQVALDRASARNDTLSLSRLNSRLSDRSVTLRHTNGQETQGTYLSCSVDSCYLLKDDTTTVPTVVRTGDIRAIEYKDHWSGLVGGLIFGFLGGVLFGSAAVALAWSGGSPVLGYPLLAACLFSFIGLPILGGLGGIPNTIVFPQDSTISTVLHQPAPPDTVQNGKETIIRTVPDSLSGDSSRGGGQSPR